MWRDVKEASQANRTIRPVISQAMLAEIFRLRAEERRCKKLARDVITQLEQGAEVEFGPLDVHVEHQRQRQFSKAKLTALLGADKVDDLLQQIDPTLREILKITDR